MKKLLLLLIVPLFFMGCISSNNTQYDTIAHKDISVKVRTLGVDVDYDSRVAIDPRKLHPMAPLPSLDEVKKSDIEPIKALE